jgi:hypothetical protein
LADGQRDAATDGDKLDKVRDRLDLARDPPLSSWQDCACPLER